MARRLAGLVGLYKVGSELFTAEGPRAVERISRIGGVFLDLKFHDIPNTVARAVAAAAALPGIKLLNVHACGGGAMIRAVREALGWGKGRPRLLAVTVLTSLDNAALREVGLQGTPDVRAMALAQLAQQNGADGVVASPNEAALIRHACGKDFLIVVPGVRPAASGKDDQARVATPGEAIRAGADYLVVGRPITAAPDPRAAARAILEEIVAARRGRV
jgi:orotidine-5'-phosphate decarboxylase